MPTFAIPNEKTTFGKQNNCWVRITVSTQDSQSCNMGSIPVPSTKSESWSVGQLFFFIYLISFWHFAAVIWILIHIFAKFFQEHFFY